MQQLINVYSKHMDEIYRQAVSCKELSASFYEAYSTSVIAAT